jgi:hypothetical protein
MRYIGNRCLPICIPIGERLPLSEAAEAQAAAEKGGIGKILLVA